LIAQIVMDWCTDGQSPAVVASWCGRAFNGTDRWELSVPVTFVVDHDAVIRFAVTIPNYLRRADPAEVMEALRTVA
jgi:peroxiredoxin